MKVEADALVLGKLIHSEQRTGMSAPGTNSSYTNRKRAIAQNRQAARTDLMAELEAES